MSVEYRDGIFGNIKPFAEAVREFNNALDAGTAKALHVGTVKEIEEVKKSKDVSEALNEMDKRLHEVFGIPPDLLKGDNRNDRKDR